MQNFNVIKNLLPTKWFGKNTQNSIFTQIIKNASSLFVFEAIYNGLMFLTTVYLARILGAKDYGVYVYVITWLQLLIIISMMGCNILLVREVAIYKTRSAWGLLRGILNWTKIITLTVSLGLTLLVGIILFIFKEHIDSNMFWVFWIALLILPLTILINLNQSVMEGLQYIVIGILPKKIFQPLLFLILTVIVSLFLDKKMSSSIVMLLRVIAVGITFLIGIRFLRIKLPTSIQKVSPKYEKNIWIKSTLPFLVIAIMNAFIMRTDVLMLGVFKGAQAVGFYYVANKGLEIMSFALLVGGVVLSPIIARLYENKDMKQLQKIVTQNTRIIFLISFCLFVLFILFSHPFLLLFGKEFVQADVALIILCIGQLINVAIGSVGRQLLMMTKFGHVAAKDLVICVILNIILNIIFIPKWGFNGAAVATTISLSIWNLLLMVKVSRKLQINTTIFG